MFSQSSLHNKILLDNLSVILFDNMARLYKQKTFGTGKAKEADNERDNL